MEDLKQFVERRMNIAKEYTSMETRKLMFHQAFGAVDFFVEMNPQFDEELSDWWDNEIREKFEEIIYGA